MNGPGISSRRIALATVAAGLASLALVGGKLTASNGDGLITRPTVGPAAVVHGNRSQYAGTLVRALHRPALTLPDTSGRLFDLRTRPTGEVTVLFFGYSNCDDICPTTMADLAAARRALSPAARRNVELVFVTEDPARDTPAVLRRWLDRFDPAIIGLTGGNGTSARVLHQLHLPPSLRYEASASPPHTHTATEAHPHPAGDSDDYEVDHSGAVYAFAPDEHAVLYTGGTTPPQFAVDFARLLRG